MVSFYPQHQRAIQATLLDVDLPFLRVLSERRVEPGGAELEILLGEQAYCLTVVPSRTESDGSTWVRLLGDTRLAQALEHQFLRHRALSKERERRDDGRTRASLKVSSPDLPGETATTFDISETGLRLVTEEAVPVGVPLRLSIEDTNGQCVEVQGMSVWSRQRLNSLFHIGVQLGGRAEVCSGSGELSP